MIRTNIVTIMAQAYRILGKNVPPHYLSIATLATVGGVIGYFKMTGKKEEKASTPVAPAKDDIDIEALLQSFVAQEGEKNRFLLMFMLFIFF